MKHDYSQLIYQNSHIIMKSPVHAAGEHRNVLSLMFDLETQSDVL